MKKQDIFKKIAKLNSDNKDVKAPKEKKPLSTKAKVSYSLLGVSAFALVLGLGIGIPISAASQSTIISKLRDSQEVGVTFSSPKGDKDLTIGTILSNYKSDSNVQRENLDKAKKSLIEFLYNQEYEASKVFNAAWENTNTSETQGNSRRFTIRSFAEIRESEKKFLEDERSRYQRTFGFDNWESEFNKYLNTDSRYNGAVNFEQALDSLAISKAVDTAFARFKLTFDTTFTLNDIENRILKDDIKDENGNIVFKKGDKLFKDIIVVGQNAESANIVNASGQKSNTNNQDDKNLKVAVFITKSFIKKYINPKNIIDELYFSANAPLKNNFQFFNISQVSINAKPNAQDFKNAWSVDKTALEQLLAYKPIKPSDQTATTNEVRNNLELLEKFQGGLSKDVDQNKNDQVLLTTLDYDGNKNRAKNLGQLPLASAQGVLNNNDASYILAFLDDIFSPKDNSQILSKTLFENIKKYVFKNNENLLPETSTLKGKDLSQIKEINRKLKDFIQGLSDNQLREAGKAFQKTFAASDSDDRLKTIYKISNQLKIALDSKGLKVIAYDKIDTYEKFAKIIKEQLQLKANNQIDSSINSTIDIAQIFSGITNNDFIQALVITDDSFKQTLVKDLGNISESAKNDFLNSVTQSSNNYLNFYILDQVLQINSKLQNYITQVTLNNSNADFKYDKTKERWELTKVPDKEARQAILDDLETRFSVRKGQK
ncbi:HinT-interacting membrane complex protein P80 [Mesomycoplasma conjunctivae]|uniref:HinT-interacting membrane complex protein P80 n=1 Tax=Mesomycoplasma conjunctivae TaxID=45361 RepID=UPI003DA3A5A2